jgi:general secretion pathway protein F
MPVFRYKAATVAGQVVVGEMEAGSRAQAIEQLRSQGHIPIRAEELSRHGRLFGLGRLLRRRQRAISQKQIGILTQELASLLRAGLPLDRALEVMINVSADEKVGSLLHSIQEKVRGGSSFAQALEDQNGVFSRFYVNMIRAGEAGGSLDAVLSRLNEYLERARSLRDSVTSALIYPAILLSVAGVSVIVLLALVVPQFQQLFADAGKTLPLSTRIVIVCGEILRDYWWVLLAGVMAVAYYLKRQFEGPTTRLAWDRRLIRMRLVGDLIVKVEVARLSRALGTLLHNGVPLLGALSIVKEIATNRVLALELGGVADRLKEGQGLSEPLMHSEIFPKLAIHMIRVGEESGQLDDMLFQVADTYDGEVQSSIKRMLSLLEPALILGLGFIIAAIIMSILVAILGMNELAF